MSRYIYANKLSNQNKTARSNLVWVADMTSIELYENKKLHIFICIDIHTNKIINFVVSKREITSKQIYYSLSNELSRRFPIAPRTKLIIHTDRGVQFTSERYNALITFYEDTVIPSMSRENTPTDNSVAERFMRTFKEHQINGKTLQEFIYKEIIESGCEPRSYRKIVRKYVKGLNEKPNRKTWPKAPEKHHTDVSTASMLMVDPKHPKAFSERFGEDQRSYEIDNYKKQNANVISVLEQLAAKRGELVDKTPFDDYETNLVLEVIDQRLTELYGLVQSNPEQVREYVEDAIEPVKERIEGLHDKVDILLPRRKKEREIQPLRDPLNARLFPLYLVNAGNVFNYKKDLKRSQLRIAYTILFHTGVRINEIRELTKEDIMNAMKISQFNLVHHKNKQSHIHLLSKQAVKDLNDLKVDFKIVFAKHKFKYLFGKNIPIRKQSLIRLINRDLANTCEKANLPFNIKSHSFRINMISSLLKKTSVQNAADIIGHGDIRSTMSYRRYALSKDEIKDLLEQIAKDE